MKVNIEKFMVMLEECKEHLKNDEPFEMEFKSKLLNENCDPVEVLFKASYDVIEVPKSESTPL